MYLPSSWQADTEHRHVKVKGSYATYIASHHYALRRG
jgi:hypothetical protein